MECFLCVKYVLAAVGIQRSLVFCSFLGKIYNLIWITGSGGKQSTYNAEDLGLIPGSERSPGGGHRTPCSILAWRTLWTEEPGRLQSTGLQKVRHNWIDLAHMYILRSRASRIIRMTASLCERWCRQLEVARSLSTSWSWDDALAWTTYPWTCAECVRDVASVLVKPQLFWISAKRGQT